MSTKPLTATMAQCVADTEVWGGELVRFQGGYWAPRRIARRSHDGVPVVYYGASTVQGLVDRGAAAYTEWRDGRRGRFPLAMRLCEAADAE